MTNYANDYGNRRAAPLYKSVFFSNGDPCIAIARLSHQLLHIFPWFLLVDDVDGPKDHKQCRHTKSYGNGTDDGKGHRIGGSSAVPDQCCPARENKAKRGLKWPGLHKQQPVNRANTAGTEPSFPPAHCPVRFTLQNTLCFRSPIGNWIVALEIGKEDPNSHARNNIVHLSNLQKISNPITC